jgi:hypothetical protein
MAPPPRGQAAHGACAAKVRVKGHVGPHPQEYHEHVFEALRDATRTCLTMQLCQASLKKALDRQTQQISTEGTHLDKLVTRTP